MSKYHGFVVPIDNLNKLVNYGTWMSGESQAERTIPSDNELRTDSGELIRNTDGTLDLSKRYFNADGSKAPQIRMEKQIDGDTVYVSECVPDSVNKRIYITSAYIKKGSTDQLLNIVPTNGTPQPTSETSFDGSTTTTGS